MGTLAFTEQEYWREVQAIAESAHEEAKEHGGGLGDYLHETIDGHQFVIYTHKARAVLLHSPNENAIFEEMGDQVAGSMEGLYSMAAYWAMLADVQSVLADAEDLFSEEDEEEAAV